MDKFLKFGNTKVPVLEFFDVGEVHISAYLSMISQMRKNAALVWGQIFPRFRVAKRENSIPVYGAEHLQEVETFRADKTPSNEVARHLGTAIDYACKKHALKEWVSEDERKNADPPIKADADAAEFVTDLMDLAREFEAYTLITTTAGYASSSHYTTLSAAQQWDNYDSADSEPLKNIDDAKKQVWDASGKRANTILIPYPVSLKLSRHSHLLEEVKYTHSDLLTAGGLPPVLKGLRVVEADAIYNTKAQGQTAVLSGLWSDYVWVGYINPAMGLKDTTWGLTFDWGGRIVRQWHNNEKNADAVEVEEQGLHMAIFDNTCGFLYIDVLA